MSGSGVNPPYLRKVYEWTVEQVPSTNYFITTYDFTRRIRRDVYFFFGSPLVSTPWQVDVRVLVIGIVPITVLQVTDAGEENGKKM